MMAGWGLAHQQLGLVGLEAFRNRPEQGLSPFGC